MWMWSTGINRNIVECKEAKAMKVLDMIQVLIETLWNVKQLFEGSVVKCIHKVLIETLWNVKFFTPLRIVLARLVLIETLWNVKFCTNHQMLRCKLCINRNIVECKAVFCAIQAAAVLGINRNIVECKGRKIKRGDFEQLLY